MAARLVFVWLVILVCGCSAPQNAAPTADPFTAVAASSRQEYERGLQLYEQGSFREAWEAFHRAELLSPAADPAIQEMVQRSALQLTPTAVPIPTPMPEPAPTTPPVATPTPLALPTTLPEPLPVAAPAPTTPPPPLPPVVIVQAPPTAPPARSPITTITIDGGPIALTYSQSGILHVADRSGAIWTIDSAQPTLRRPLTVAGQAAGLAYDDANNRLLVVLRSPPALLALDLATGQSSAAMQLPAEPDGVQIDPSLGLAFVLMPAQDALALVDLSTFAIVATAYNLDDVTDFAVDRDAHAVYVSHGSGELSVLDATGGVPGGVYKLTDTGLSGVAGSNGHAYAISASSRELFIVETGTGSIARVPLPDEPAAVAASPNSLHVLRPHARVLVQLDPATGAELRRGQLDPSVVSADPLPPEEHFLRPRIRASNDGSAAVVDPRTGHVALFPPG